MNAMVNHETYMELALRYAERALEAGEFPVGCVIEHCGQIIASGSRVSSIGIANEMDHAEMIALRAMLNNTEKIKVKEVTVYSTMEPCLMCFSTLLVNGVTRFVFSFEDVMGGGTNLPLERLSPLYSELKLSITGGVLRKKSLALFQRFFSSKENTYLQGSLLEKYTLEQLV
jgi:tRNA(adenine34) deaminase